MDALKFQIHQLVAYSAYSNRSRRTEEDYNFTRSNNYQPCEKTQILKRYKSTIKLAKQYKLIIMLILLIIMK